MLDEMERSVHDALCVVKRVLESDQVVAGGGCVEAALSIHLGQFAKSLGSREQLAISEFAESLLVIPKTLSVNAALDATELVSQLRATHYAEQTAAPGEYDGMRNAGLDLFAETVTDNLGSLFTSVRCLPRFFRCGPRSSCTQLTPPPEDPRGH